MKECSNRIKKLRNSFNRLKIGGIIINGVENVRYLSGFTGDSSMLFVTRKDVFFITDSRYTIQAKEELPRRFKIIIHTKGIINAIEQIIKEKRIKRVGFEACNMKFVIYDAFKKKLKKVKLIPLMNEIEKIRMIKSVSEITKLKEAIKCAKKGLNGMLNSLKPGITEKQMAFHLIHHMMKSGAENYSFEPIIGINERAALPHAPLTSKKLNKNSLLLIDWGAIKDFYVSDTTRVFFMGKPKEEMRKVYQIVLAAQKKAIEAVKPGVLTCTLDNIARTYITEKGYGQYFNHSLGHGIGRHGHEIPGISGNKNTGVKLQPGMVFTIEPGIYIPNVGGVRIEDMIYVTKNGYEVLTSSIPKSLSKAVIKL